MKNFLLIQMLFLCLLSNAQQKEFETYSNGLIYSENAISKLKKIVDSLNLKHKICDVNKKYFTTKQTNAHYVYIEKKNALQAKKDFENNISFLDFKVKYPKAFNSYDLLVIMNEYINYDEKNVIEINSLELGKSSEHSIIIDNEKSKEDLKGKWIFKYSPKTNYSSESVEAFYIIENFKSNQLSKKYSKLVQYADCLIDTAATVFYKNSKENGVRYFDSIPNKAMSFVQKVNEVLKKPMFVYDDMFAAIDTAAVMAKRPNKKLSKKQKIKIEEDEKRSAINWEVYRQKIDKWESKRLVRLDSLFQNDSKFIKDLNEAFQDSKTSKSSNDEFEEFVGRYISKNDELELKRNRRVIGGCSMDNSPRVHAMNIALLSAETIKWDIFLKSHLNIMNDRFDRVSDGSWAQKERETYIKELEVLDIDIQNLIIGTSLRIENPAINHYYSSINRVGRALSESNFKNQIENFLLEMISDSELDDYNRVLMYYLFDNYNYNLKDENAIILNLLKLKTAVAKLPFNISSRIEIKN